MPGGFFTDGRMPLDPTQRGKKSVFLILFVIAVLVLTYVLKLAYDLKYL
jgi:hypothetical protein